MFINDHFREIRDVPLNSAIFAEIHRLTNRFGIHVIDLSDGSFRYRKKTRFINKNVGISTVAEYSM
jgi:hypothetical protein